MKVMKTMKKLKFWSRKKKKKKATIDHDTPTPCRYCCCHHQDYQPLQPSAPPLPSWLDYEDQTYDHSFLASEVKVSSFSGLPSSNQVQYDPQGNDISNAAPELVNQSSSSSSYSNLPGDVKTSCSYQQYMVENPVYGVPVVPTAKRDRSAGAAGCVVNIGALLFQCFCPCFRMREV